LAEDHPGGHDQTRTHDALGHHGVRLDARADSDDRGSDDRGIRADHHPVVEHHGPDEAGRGMDLTPLPHLEPAVVRGPPSGKVVEHHALGEAEQVVLFRRSKAPPSMGTSLLGTPRSARVRRSSRSEVYGNASTPIVQETGSSEQATPDVKSHVASS
jgi:hypothetical protein